MHDVYNDNFVNVRDRLGWKREEDPNLQTSKEKTLREGFTWVPSGLTREKVSEYSKERFYLGPFRPYEGEGE